MKRILHPLAILELREASEWYRHIDQDLSEALIFEFERKADHILINPFLYNIRDHGFRRVNLHRFPYYLPFSVEDDEIVILAVAHHARKPGYWKTRI